jgi:membrane protein YqaA with SNARE-associated domain
MGPEQETDAYIGGNGVATADPGTLAHEAARGYTATGSSVASVLEPDTPAYKSFRELPRITHISGTVIVILGLAALILSLFEVRWNGLLWLFFYSIPANTAISVFPHEPVIVYTGQYFDPVIVAMVALAGNLAAGYVDYHFFTPVLQMKFSAGYRKTNTYQRAIRWFDRAPFWAVVVFALTPLPFYLVKFLVFSSGYSMPRYMLGIAVGRLPRFYLLALLGVVVHVPVWLMVAIFSAIFAVYIFFIVRGFWRARVARRDPILSE